MDINKMNKLYKLKEWFSIEEAAERLSSAFGQPVTKRDVIQLVIDGRLRLSYYLQPTPARPVVLATNLLNYFGGDDKDPTREPCTDISGLVIKEAVPSIYSAVLRWHHLWGDPTKDVTSILSGPHVLEMSSPSMTRHWLASLLLDQKNETPIFEGLLVRDDMDCLWQVLTYEPRTEVKDSNGNDTTVGGFYYEGGDPPTESALIIQRKHVQEFENSFAEQTIEQEREVTGKERAVFLRAIYAMTAKIVGLEQIEKSKTRAAEIVETELGDLCSQGEVKVDTLRKWLGEAEKLP